MEPYESVSLIATTYNQPADLDLYLRSLKQQTYAAFEIVIADDGSGEETRRVIAHHQREWAGPRLKHVWHEDQGYRKAKIVNEAVRQSSGQWLVFTDSDHLVHPQFVADHVSQRGTNRLFMGRRVDLTQPVSDWIRKNPVRLFKPGFYLRILSVRGANRTLRIAWTPLARALGAFRVPDLLGSNFSIARDLLFRVNGFDESNEHYWGEDGDLYARVSHVGAEIYGRKMFAVQLHLWHPLRKPKPDAEVGYRNRLADPHYQFCKIGLQVKSGAVDSSDIQKA